MTIKKYNARIKELRGKTMRSKSKNKVQVDTISYTYKSEIPKLKAEIALLSRKINHIDSLNENFIVTATDRVIEKIDLDAVVQHLLENESIVLNTDFQVRIPGNFGPTTGHRNSDVEFEAPFLQEADVKTTPSKRIDSGSNEVRRDFVVASILEGLVKAKTLQYAEDSISDIREIRGSLRNLTERLSKYSGVAEREENQ